MRAPILKLHGLICTIAALVIASAAGQAEIKTIDDLKELREKEDQTIWKDAVEAEKRFQTIVALWDKLRASEDPFETFRTFPLGRVERPRLRLGRKLPERIFEFVHERLAADTPQFLKRYEIETLTGRYAQEGYALEQTEWSHEEFGVGEDGKYWSRVSFSIHVSGPTHTLYRRIFRGTLKIYWSDETNDEELYLPDRVEFEKLAHLRRSGALAFAEGLWQDGKKEQLPFRQVLVEDMNKDGKPDIVLPHENRWYQNFGDFKFEAKPLVPKQFWLPIAAAVVVDLDLDGELEYVTASTKGVLSAHVKNRKTGQYDKKPEILWKTKKGLSPQTFGVGDVNGDGYPDLFVGQYRYPYRDGTIPNPYHDANDAYDSYILINSKKLRFRDETGGSGLAAKNRRRVVSSAMLDLDGDARSELISLSDFAGLDIYQGGGKEYLSDRTDDVVDQNKLFGSSLTLSDFDRNGTLDLFAAGTSYAAARRLEASGMAKEGFDELNSRRAAMAHGSRLYDGLGGGAFKESKLSSQVALSGAAFGSGEVDFNNDGFPDLFVANGHVSRDTAKDYDDVMWRHDIYDTATYAPAFMAAYLRFHGPGQLFKDDKISFGGHQANRFYFNMAGDEFLDVGYLLGLSNTEDGRIAVSEDFDMDGKVDLLLVTLDAKENSQNVYLYKNMNRRAGNWIGVDIVPTKGKSIVGAKLILETESFKTERVYTVGNTYAGQDASRFHVGIGEDTTIKNLEVIWPDGETSKVTSPSINKYHTVIP